MCVSSSIFIQLISGPAGPCQLHVFLLPLLLSSPLFPVPIKRSAVRSGPVPKYMFVEQVGQAGGIDVRAARDEMAGLGEAVDDNPDGVCTL